MRQVLGVGLLVLALAASAAATAPVPALRGAWLPGASEAEPRPDPGPIPGFGVLVFSRTAGYRHDSIPHALRALERLASERGWTLVASENAAAFHDGFLGRFDVVVWLSTTGDVLSGEQEQAFERYVEAGGGWVGIHSASDTEYDWPWYGRLVGAFFARHTQRPHLPEADVVIEDRDHPATAALPRRWRRADEWYAFRTNPRPRVRVLASLDESSFDPGEARMGDHPLIWCQELGAARSLYTAIGHTPATWSEPLALEHVAAAVEWAGRKDGSGGPSGVER
jgi:type 1 glutamine amidotransferase